MTAPTTVALIKAPKSINWGRLVVALRVLGLDEDRFIALRVTAYEAVATVRDINGVERDVTIPIHRQTP